MEGKILFSQYVIDKVKSGEWEVLPKWWGDLAKVRSKGRRDAAWVDSFEFVAWRKGWWWNRQWEVILYREHDKIDIDQDEKDALAAVYFETLQKADEKVKTRKTAEQLRLEARRWYP